MPRIDSCDVLSHKKQGPSPGMARYQLLAPNLNSIENLWIEMKDKVADQQPLIAKDQIIVLKKVWLKLSKEYYKSYPRCAKAFEGSNQERWRIYKILNFDKA